MTIQEALDEVAMAETVEKKPIRAPEVLNEAFHYERPSSF
jgi:hypothetical protein